MNQVRSALLLFVFATLAACGGQTSSVTTESNTTASTALTTERTTTTLAPTTTTTTSTTVAEQAPTTFKIEVAGGEVTGGGRLRVKQGDEVTLEVIADVTDEVHLHGYDLSGPVSPDQQAVIEFIADIPGIFEIELEDSGLALAELEVAP